MRMAPRRDGRGRVLPRSPPGHDSWVVGDEPYVSLHVVGSEVYAGSRATRSGRLLPGAAVGRRHDPAGPGRSASSRPAGGRRAAGGRADAELLAEGDGPRRAEGELPALLPFRAPPPPAQAARCSRRCVRPSPTWSSSTASRATTAGGEQLDELEAAAAALGEDGASGRRGATAARTCSRTSRSRRRASARRAPDGPPPAVAVAQPALSRSRAAAARRARPSPPACRRRGRPRSSGRRRLEQRADRVEVAALRGEVERGHALAVLRAAERRALVRVGAERHQRADRGDAAARRRPRERACRGRRRRQRAPRATSSSSASTRSLAPPRRAPRRAPPAGRRTAARRESRRAGGRTAMRARRAAVAGDELVDQLEPAEAGGDAQVRRREPCSASSSADLAVAPEERRRPAACRRRRARRRRRGAPASSSIRASREVGVARLVERRPAVGVAARRVGAALEQERDEPLVAGAAPSRAGRCRSSRARHELREAVEQRARPSTSWASMAR